MDSNSLDLVGVLELLVTKSDIVYSLKNNPLGYLQSQICQYFHLKR
jgi:hypothetical protein